MSLSSRCSRCSLGSSRICAERIQVTIYENSNARVRGFTHSLPLIIHTCCAREIRFYCQFRYTRTHVQVELSVITWPFLSYVWENRDFMRFYVLILLWKKKKKNNFPRHYINNRRRANGWFQTGISMTIERIKFSVLVHLALSSRIFV